MSERLFGITDYDEDMKAMGKALPGGRSIKDFVRERPHMWGRESKSEDVRDEALQINEPMTPYELSNQLAKLIYKYSHAQHTDYREETSAPFNDLDTNPIGTIIIRPIFHSVLSKD